MSEEEIKAMNECKILMISLYDYMSIEKSRFYCNQYKIILELIEKQQKEIEKLKDDLREERAFSKSALETLKECVHKDTIKEKIKKCNSILYSSEEEERQLIARQDIGSVNCLLAQISILNSLLGE